MKKLGYTCDKSLGKLFAIGGIALLVVGVFFAILGFILSGGDIFGLITSLFILPFVLIFCFLFFVLPIVLIITATGKRVRDMHELIRRNGVKLKGYIKGYTTSTTMYSDAGMSTDCHLIVSYYTPSNEQRTFKTPQLNFIPTRDLGSRECTVYYYNDQVFATDFVPALNESQRVLTRNDYIK